MIAQQSNEELTGRQVISAYGVVAHHLISRVFDSNRLTNEW
jgi:hypothetical protein